MKLKFGKFKGKYLKDTPQWYQDWLTKQEWFKPVPEKPLHALLNGWDGYSRKGQAVYDAIFEQEMMEGVNMGIECQCGLPKYVEDEYCGGDHCTCAYL